MIRKTLFFFVLAAAFTGGVSAENIEILKEVPSTFVFPAGGFLPFNIHRANQTMLSLMVPGAVFNDPAGVACALLKSDHDPRDPTADVVVTAVGVNSGAGELFYNVGLKDVRIFGSRGSGPKQFLAPSGVAIHPNGDVAVADTGNNRIVLLRHDGLRMIWVKAVGKKGKRAGEFNAPMGVAFDTEGNLYIADAGNNRLQCRTPQGKFRILAAPPLESPSALCVMDSKEDWTFYKQGPFADRLAVIDQQGKRLSTLTLGGSPLTQVTAREIADPPVRLWGCAFDYYGNVVATDFAKSCLRKFDRNLKPLVFFGSEGDGDYQFTEPRGIAINRQFGQMIVAEKDSAQYYWNGADAVSLKTVQEGGKIRIPFFLTERALLDAEIRTPGAGGERVKVLAKGQDLEEGPQELDWAPEAGQAEGEYLLKMRVMATYSSRDRVAKEIALPVTYSK
jgi:DNA-binding beta-propeller fold protein YncE